LQSVELQADEMWSFVRHKKFKRWIWVVYCPAIKQILAFHIGGRSKADAQQLFDKLPARLRDNCRFATDYWEAYYQTIPSEQQHPSKALTYFVEGYFTGVRARVSRLVRRSAAFSKKLENHIAAIGYFFWQRNLTAHHYF
jgi:IS1 family transposase